MSIPKPVRQITGKTVLYGMLAFFGVIFAVNMTFMYLALNSWPELVSKRAYLDGLEYNDTLAAAKVQSDRGWSSMLDYDGKEIVVNMTDKSQAPLMGLSVNLTLRRPINDIADIEVILRELPDHPGVYRTNLTLPLKGRWYGVIKAVRADGIDYRMEHKISVGP
jgi:nitrogen fixation protein FixH